MNKDSTVKDESIKKKKKRNKNKSTQFLINLGDNKIITLIKDYDNFNLDELPKWRPQSPNNRKKRRKLINDEKNIEKYKSNYSKKKNNINKSINSIATVDSKLFNNKMEYDNFKTFITKDDVSILEDILYELDINKK